MELSIGKKQIIQAIEELPDDTTIEQAIYKLHVLEEVTKAIADPARYTQDEVEEYFRHRRENRKTTANK